MLPGEATLLVLDDAFSTAEAAAFRLASGRTTVLVTTRDGFLDLPLLYAG